MRTIISMLLTLLTASLAARAGDSLSAETLLAGHEATQAHAPVAAFGKEVFLVVWEAGRSEKADIVGLRLDKSGKPLDVKPFVISGAKDCQERPRVAFGGGVFLVVWQDLRNGKDWDVYAARVTPEGKVLDPEGIAVSAEACNQCQPAACFDGKAFQILWRDMRDGKDYDCFGARVSSEGKSLDDSGALVQGRFKGAYNDYIGAPGVGATPDGKVVGAARLEALSFWTIRDNKGGGKAQSAPKRTEKMPGQEQGWAPAFASDGKKLLAVFTTFRPVSRGGASPGSGAILVDPATGAPGEIVHVSSQELWASCIRNPSVAWDGKTYVVAWDMKRSTPRPANKSYDAVSLRRISADGKPLDADMDVAGEADSPAYHPTAASDGAGTTLIAYERHPKTGDVPIKIGFRMLTTK